MDFLGSLAVETLPSNTGDAGLIPGQEAKISHASQPNNRNIKQKQYKDSTWSVPKKKKK